MILADVAFAYQIFAQARQRWDQQAYPQLIRYTTAVTVREQGAERTERYLSEFDVPGNRVWIDPVSDYEAEHPSSGRGFGGWNLDAVPHPAPDIDFIGVPMLSPVYSFGLRAGVPMSLSNVRDDAALIKKIRDEFHDPSPATRSTSSNSGLREITTVTAYPMYYDVGLAGDEQISGHDCFHLKLTPRSAPALHRLRDLWIDRSSYSTIRAQTALNFVSGPGSGIPWQIDFSTLGGAYFIQDEYALAPYRYAGHSYSEVRISFERVSSNAAPFPLQVATPGAFLVLTEPPEGK